MEETKLDKLKRIANKASILEKGGQLAIAKEFDSLEQGLSSIESNIENIKGSIDTKLGELSEELKKKLESELVLEIEKDELKGEQGEPGKDYTLTEKDKKDIATKIKVPIVNKIIEKFETRIEQPIYNTTTEIKEVAMYENGQQIVQKINSLSTDSDDNKISWYHLKDVPNPDTAIRGGGGSRFLSRMADVVLTNIQNNDVLKWNTTTNKWENGAVATSTAWGSITGTLSDQTDLQSALNTKLSIATAALTYQPLDADLTAIAALTGTSGFLKTSGAGTWTVDTAAYLTGITVNATTITGGTTGRLPYNNAGTYGETAFTYDSTNQRLALNQATPLYSLDFAVSGAFTSGNGNIRVTDSRTSVPAGNNLIGLSITAGASAVGGIGGGTKIGLEIIGSGFWSHNIGTQWTGLRIPAYSGSVYANYKVGAYIGEKLVLGAESLQNNDSLLQLFGATGSSILGQNTIMFNGGATNGYISGLTVVQDNSANIGGGIWFARTLNNIGYDILFSNINMPGYVKTTRMRMFCVSGNISVGTNSDRSVKFWVENAAANQFGVGWNASNNFVASVDSAGITTFTGSGASARFAFANSIYTRAGTATAGTAPMYMTSGPVLTTPVVGAHEFLTDDYFLTITTGAARKGIILDDGARLTSGRIPIAGTNGRLVDDADLTFVTDTLTATKIVGSTSVKSALVESTGTVRLKGYTVATLPVGVVGDTAYVTDALAPAFLTTVVGGGAIVTPVFYDGANWIAQ